MPFAKNSPALLSRASLQPWILAGAMGLFCMGHVHAQYDPASSAPSDSGVLSQISKYLSSADGPLQHDGAVTPIIKGHSGKTSALLLKAKINPSPKAVTPISVTLALDAPGAKRVCMSAIGFENVTISRMGGINESSNPSDCSEVSRSRGATSRSLKVQRQVVSNDGSHNDDFHLDGYLLINVVVDGVVSVFRVDSPAFLVKSPVWGPSGHMF